MTKFLKTIYFEFFERKFSKGIELEEIILSKYTLVRWIKKQDKDNLYSVGIFKRGDRKVVAKILHYRHHNLSYLQLRNEVDSIKFLSHILKGQKKLSVPRIINVIDKNKRLILITEFIAGTTADNFSAEKNYEILNTLLNFFSNASLGSKKNTLNKNYPVLLFATISYYAVAALVKNLFAYKQIINLFGMYLGNISILDLVSPKYEITHKDIHPKNLLVKNGKIYLLDTEYLSYSSKRTDLSISLRHFSDTLTEAQLVATLNNFIHTYKDFRLFISLSSFYTLQILAVDSKAGSDYRKAMKYAKTLYEMKSLTSKKDAMLFGLN